MGSTGCQLHDDLKACEAFCEGEDRFVVTTPFAHHAIYLPMSGSLPPVDLHRAMFDGEATGRALGLSDAVVGAFTLRLLPEVFVCYIRDESFVYVSVEGGGADCPFILLSEGFHDGLRGVSFFDLIGYVLGVLVIVAEFERLSLYTLLPLRSPLCYLCTIQRNIFPCSAVPVIICTLFDFVADCGHRAVEEFCDGGIGGGLACEVVVGGVVMSFNQESFCPCDTAVLSFLSL